MAGYLKLPEDVRRAVIGENIIQPNEENDVLQKFLKPVIGKDSSEFDQSKFIISFDKWPDKKWPKPLRHKLKKLSYRDRRLLGLYSIKRKSLKYEELLPLHELWKSYMKSYLNLNELNSKSSKEVNDYISAEQTGLKLYRADYHGAELVIIRSVCPGYVGKSGILAMETKNCFLLVGKDNITRRISKATCQFQFKIDDLTFSFFGKNFISRPAERSSRKIKTVHLPTL